MENNRQGDDKKLKSLMIGFSIALIMSLFVIVCCFFEPWNIFSLDTVFSPAKIEYVGVKPGEIILSKDPFKSPSLFIIEEPTLELSQYAVKEHSKIPLLYKEYPDNISVSIQEYLEKRNQYIQDFTEKYLYIDEENEEALHPPFDSCREIDEIIPFTYKNTDAVFVVSEEVALLNSNMDVLEIEDSTTYQMAVSASVNFTDRFWNLYAHAGATGGYVYYDVVDENYFTNKTTYFLGGNYDYDVDPLSIMKITKCNTNPTMEYYFKSPNRDLFSFYFPGSIVSSLYRFLLNFISVTFLCVFLFSLCALFILALMSLYRFLHKLICLKKEKRGSKK